MSVMQITEEAVTISTDNKLNIPTQAFQSIDAEVGDYVTFNTDVDSGVEVVRAYDESLNLARKVTTRGITTLPPSVQEEMGVSVGDKVVFSILSNGEVRIFKDGR